MTTATLTRPGELASVVPQLLGFVPRRSAVVVSLCGPRRRVGLLQRLDLCGPAGEAVPDAVWAKVAARVAADGLVEAVLVVYDAAGRAPVAAVGHALEAVGIRLAEVLLVDGDRWRSALCRDPACCPPDGSPLPAAGSSPALTLVGAESALLGRAVLRSREALAASITAPDGRSAAALAAQLARAAAELEAEQRARGLWACRARQRAAWRRAVRRAADPRALPGAALGARLVVSLADPVLRDAVVADSMTHLARMRVLAEALCQRSVTPHDAPICALLATVAYLQGDGALARIAVERALDDDPSFSWAQLLEAALDAAIPPEAIRQALVAAGAVARRRLERPDG